MTKGRLSELLAVIALAYCGWLGTQVVSIRAEVSVVASQTDALWKDFVQRRMNIDYESLLHGPTDRHVTLETEKR